MNDLKSEFEKHQRNGYLGDPEGEDAYGYGRASSEKQNEDGSSFSRQMERIHLTALRDHLRISFEMLYFDDGYSGFEFENRPALNNLRKEVSIHLRAKHIVFEDIDRLSRDSDWHQGFLLAEFAKLHIIPHFFISPGSQLERYVRGYIAQEGMRKDIARMQDGTLRKARDGRVTAKRAKYGYVLTDRKDSHYVLHPEESRVVRWVFEQIIYHGKTINQIAREMNDKKIPTVFKNKFWAPGSLYIMITSTVYKGEFYANMRRTIKTGKYHDNGRPQMLTRIRPQSEWIKVPVPAIVTPEEWELAREVMRKNSKLAKKNSKRRQWLLQGLVKCAICQTYSLITNQNPKGTGYYSCYSSRSQKAKRTNTACFSPQIEATKLERRVWEELEKVLYDPGIIIHRLEERQAEEQNNEHDKQLKYLEEDKAKLNKERVKLENAYNKDVYTLEEFVEKMNDIKARLQIVELSKAKVEAKIAEVHSLEEQKQVVLNVLNRVRAEVEKAKREKRLPEEIPFELKRKLLGKLVDVIYVDTQKRKFTIEGEIKGTYAIDDEDSYSESGNGSFGSNSAP